MNLRTLAKETSRLVIRNVTASLVATFLNNNVPAATKLNAHMIIGGVVGYVLSEKLMPGIEQRIDNYFDNIRDDFVGTDDNPSFTVLS